MGKRNIIVIGASSGGVQAIKDLLAGITEKLDAAIFIVWHMAPEVEGVLPRLINNLGKMEAAAATNLENIEMNRIYVAPPDRHLLLEENVMRLSRGPKENRFRPAVDPLFRSAAYYHGSRVIGIVLSGYLDDGTAGLWTIKSRGGIAIVQDPAEANFPSMPQSALNAVEVDHCVSVHEMGALLAKLCSEDGDEFKALDMDENKKTKLEIDVAIRPVGVDEKILELGVQTSFTCPDCHGVLSAIWDGKIKRYRCHTGHAFSAGSLLASVEENIENSLWTAIRAMEESILLLNNVGDNHAATNEPQMAAMYFKKANECEGRAELLRRAVWSQDEITPQAVQSSSEEARR